jgi:uncharacterized membrane protein YhaH (DUF805 family)
MSKTTIRLCAVILLISASLPIVSGEFRMRGEIIALLLASAWLFWVGQRKKNDQEIPKTFFKRWVSTECGTTQGTQARGLANRLHNWWFWIWQIAPPSVMLAVVFGTWNIGTMMILGIPFLYSFYRVISLGVRRQFNLMLRPVLTFSFAVAVMVMGGYYDNQSMLYVREMAQTMQEQCNRDGYCALPPGSWKQDDHYQRLYYGRSPGLVSFRIVLTFDEPAPSANAPSSSLHPTEKDNQAQSVPTFRKYTAFHLVRHLEDFDYNVYGGVGLPLISGGHGFSP